jgi:hypothetical protein
MEVYCIKTISMPVLRVFVNFEGCAVERGCFKGFKLCWSDSEKLIRLT